MSNMYVYMINEFFDKLLLHRVLKIRDVSLQGKAYIQDISVFLLFCIFLIICMRLYT